MGRARSRRRGGGGSPPFRRRILAVTRAAVVGLGLIGGSAALALKARGYDRDTGARLRARERGIDAVESLAEAVLGSDVVLLAVSTGETPGLLRDAAAAA